MILVDVEGLKIKKIALKATKEANWQEDCINQLYSKYILV